MIIIASAIVCLWLPAFCLGEIPGKPGLDYPVFSSVPDIATLFECSGASIVHGGYYADLSTDCQVFHVCVRLGSKKGYAKKSFICPIGTKFNQRLLVCQWWYDVMCPKSDAFYYINEEIDAERKAYTNPRQKALVNAKSLPLGSPLRSFQPKHKTSGYLVPLPS